MNILVTGATGFVGSHLCRKLLSEGHSVYGISKTGLPNRINDIINSENFRLMTIDLVKDPLEKLPTDIQIIFHAASQQPSSPEITFEDFFRGNILTTQRIIDHYSCSDLRLFVYFSTTMVYGDNQATIIEDSPINLPLNNYALSKKWAEEYITNLQKSNRFSAVILRCTSIFGLGHNGGIVYSFFESAKSNRSIKVYSLGQKKRNIVHISDVVNLCVSIVNNCESLKGTEIFLVGSRNSLNMLEIAKFIKNNLGSKAEIELVDTETYSTLIDISKAKKYFGYNPMSVENGLTHYIRERE